MKRSVDNTTDCSCIDVLVFCGFWSLVQWTRSLWLSYLECR